MLFLNLGVNVFSETLLLGYFMHLLPSLSILFGICSDYRTALKVRVITYPRHMLYLYIVKSLTEVTNQ